jgi:hypothetical protein
MDSVKITWVKGMTIFLFAVGVSFYIGNVYFSKHPPASTNGR